MPNEKFPIGFWNYNLLKNQKVSDVKDWVDLGMTLAMSPEFKQGDSKEKMIELLDECSANGIKVIMCDYRSYWGGATDNPEEYEEKFRKAYEDFGKHPAVMGFHVGDEPGNEKDFNDCANANKIQLKVAPELVPFINFYPYWPGQEISMLKKPSFENWVDDMAKKSDFKLLCYDCYAQMNPEDAGTDLYFNNLRLYVEAAKRAGVPAWTTLLSVGHFRFRCPKEDDLRWQLNTAVASGMKGLLWFFIYMRDPSINYRVSPIDEFGERTETFEWLSRVNRHFSHHFGDFFCKANHIATYHTVKAWGNNVLFEKGKVDTVITDVSCPQGLGAVVGIFEKDGDSFVAIVNNSKTESGEFRLHVKKENGRLDRLSWKGTLDPLKTNCFDAYYSETDTEIIGGDWLAPGQMKVYRV